MKLVYYPVEEAVCIISDHDIINVLFGIKVVNVELCEVKEIVFCSTKGKPLLREEANLSFKVSKLRVWKVLRCVRAKVRKIHPDCSVDMQDLVLQVDWNFIY